MHWRHEAGEETVQAALFFFLCLHYHNKQCGCCSALRPIISLGHVQRCASVWFLCAHVLFWGVFPFSFPALLLIKPLRSNIFRATKILTQTKDSDLSGLRLDFPVLIKTGKCCRRRGDKTHETCLSVLHKFTLNDLNIIYILLLLRSPAGECQSLYPSR